MRLVAALACLLLTNQAGFSYQAGVALLEPPDGKVYHGTGTAFGAHVGYLAALADSTIFPKVRSIFLSVPGTRPPATVFRGLREFFASADTHGFIPEVGLFLVTSEESDTGATDSIIAVSSVYDSFLDSIIAISQNYGKAMFVRIGPEFNGWWNGGGYHAYYYVLAFQKIVNMYSARGFRDSIATVWCYEPDGPNDFDSVGVQGPLWYPGDTFVDWFGLDVFDADHFDQSLPDTVRGQITRKGKSERFLGMARSRSKPVYLNETSAVKVRITADSLDSWNDWNAWFVKFWQFMDHHIEIKGFNYLNQNWEHTGHPGWGDARIQSSPYITTWYRGEVRRPRYIHLHSPVTSVHEHPASPGQFVLEQNYPNPFNPTTTIKFSIGSASGRTGEPARVTLKVYDVLGKEVVTLVDERKQPGVYAVTWDAGNVPSGAYFYRLTTPTFSQTKSMVLMK